MTDETPRTVVLGFDALAFRYLDRFAEVTPNLQSLREDGVEASLRSTFPPWTGSAWPSMYTGVDPSHHGVYSFFQYDHYPDEGSVITRNDVDAPALWNYLNAEDVSVAVMNVPVTHPAEPVSGALIPGYLATEDSPGYPEAVRDELSEAIGEPYRIYSSAETSTDKEEKLAGYLDLLDLRRRAALSFLDSTDWEFAFVQVQKTDAVFHNFDDDAAFRKVYATADRLVGHVLDAVEDDVNVVVCSDHGIGPTRGHRIYVNEVLRRHGYIETTSERSHDSLDTVKADLTSAETSDGTEPTALSRAVTKMGLALDRLGVSPADVYAAARRVGVGDRLLALAPSELRGATGENVDWRASKAYCRSSSRLGIRINLEGREPDGIVPQSEYEAVRDDIVDLLSGLRTPDGKPAFEFVKRREEVYDGPHADRADDVLFLPRGMDNQIAISLYGRRFLSVDTYDHKRDGVFIGTGPGFESDAPETLSLTDVAPICMALLGRPVPTRMTGRVPGGLLSVPVDECDYPDVDFGTDEVEPTDDEEVTERLEDLGYL
ncbi:alkaline phosphatase family protein [Halegenticoccus tardaugens]|uniref:alkaline phosphatase family protein n=1 Tax=Halegenticoccus tardaugens TaxID=2071624 RepID=UPI00100B9312|nr:alkaline phosphatase family protein [Halegenticoccus tardaugens]